MTFATAAASRFAGKALADFLKMAGTAIGGAAKKSTLNYLTTLANYFIALKKSFHSFGRTTSIYLSPFCDENTGRKIDADYRLMIDDFLRRVADGMDYEEAKKNRKALKR